MNTKTIVVTGGHLTPALAVIDELLRLSPKTTIIFAGRMSALEGDRTVSAEFEAIQKRNIPFVSIMAGRLTRHISWSLFLSICKIPIGFMQSLKLIRRVKPDVIVSFGGYIALPVALAGWLNGVTVVTHEQTTKAGLSNKIIGLFAKKIFVSFPETKGYFPSEKTIVSGLPLRTTIFTPPIHPTFSREKEVPLLYITGGSTGAKSLNDILFPIVPELVTRYMVVHQVGHPSLSKAEDIRLSLTDKVRKRYVIKEYMSESDVAYLYRHATLVIGRAGANTVAEVAATGSVGLFIPLPWAANNEQYTNASILKDAGSATILDQTTLTPETVRINIEAMVAHRKKFETAAARLAKNYPRNAASSIAKEILS